MCRAAAMWLCLPFSGAQGEVEVLIEVEFKVVVLVVVGAVAGN